MYFRNFIVAGACLLMLTLPLRAQEAALLPHSDSVAARLAPAPASRAGRWVRQPVVRALLVPTVLLGVGALTTKKVELLETDEEVREEIREHMVRPATTIDNYLRYAPGLATLGLGLAGVRGRHSPANQALLAALAFTLNDAVTTRLKYLTQVERPDGSDRHSFPSAHTSVAFASATLLHQEYGARSVWYSVGGYSVAALTGGLRMAKDNHWLSDVLAGAGVGILSTQAAYWLYPRVQRPLQKVLGNRALVLPNYHAGAVGAVVVVAL